ncbi:sulfotransferase domain-containing protein [Vreelandella titanicae]|uniref:sulfotransferase domain-containing protein n=1 Tax=Vreelandella titanicae TaxID=664683 RepID=UPI001C962307|nr:sulfotransferase domain-containing protein [Halomonas titanicae]
METRPNLHKRMSAKGRTMKTCVLVLGMHRSGTSAVTGVLEKLGTALPQELMPPQIHNPKGYFEGVRVMGLNDQFLEGLNSNWDDTRFSVAIPDSLVDKHLDAVKEFIKKDFTYNKIFAIKDPRICITFPLWERALKELEIDLKVILPYRNPFEVARSLKSRNDFSTEKSLLMWVKHILYAEKYSRPYSRLFLSFNGLLANAEKEVVKIADFVGIEPEPSAVGEVRSNFLEKELKHHNLDLKNVAEEIPYFIKKLLSFVEKDSFKEVTTVEFDTIFNEVSSLYQLMHTHDVQFQSDISRALHAQRDQARARAQSLEQQLSEQQHANEQFSQSREELLRQLETEKVQLEQTRAEQVEKSQAKIKSLENEKAELAGVREQLDSEMSNLVDALEAVKKDKQTQKASDADRIYALEQQLNKQHHVNEQALQSKEEQLRQLKAEKAQLEQTRAGQVEQGQAKIKALEDEKAELTAVREQLEVKMAQMEYTRADREEEYKIKIKELEDEKARLVQDRDKLAQEVKSLTESIDQVVNDLSCIKESKSWIYTKPIRNLHKVFFKTELERQ